MNPAAHTNLAWLFYQGQDDAEEDADYAGDVYDVEHVEDVFVAGIVDLERAGRAP